MNSPGLLLLDPVLVPKPWGGTRLATLGGKPPAGRSSGGPSSATRYGESWEVADLPHGALSASARGRTRVARGPQRGKTLRRLIDEYGPGLLGSASATPAGDFPLLFKLLDTAEHLSIQVHPDRARAATDPRWLPKTESWYVLDAEPGATILMGFRAGVDIRDIAARAGTPRLADLMKRVAVSPGEFHHVPAGTVHALGAGITVAEVQTPSDTTFRLYDWTEEYDRPPRPLQIGRALDSIHLAPPGVLSREAMDREGVRRLVDTPDYWVREHRRTGRPMALREHPELRILAVARGRARMRVGNESFMYLEAGSTVVVPAAVAERTEVRPDGTCKLLEIGLA